MGRTTDMTAQVKDAILHAGMTRRQLGLRASVSEATLSLFLSGKRGMAFDSFVKLAAVLGLELRHVRMAGKGGKGKVKHGKRKQ
jgi:transcriptional regulator with XRE-family HTH domain